MSVLKVRDIREVVALTSDRRPELVASSISFSDKGESLVGLLFFDTGDGRNSSSELDEVESGTKTNSG